MSRDWNPKNRHKCHDCGVLEGEFHKSGCDMERCPFCLGQDISCGCRYKHFYPTYKNPFIHSDLGKILDLDDTCGLPLEVYENGLPEVQNFLWKQLCDEKGRIPYIRIPNMCVRCGESLPDMFMADDWNRVVPANIRHKMLCYDCYSIIKEFCAPKSPPSKIYSVP